MTQEAFTPPVKKEDVISLNQGPEGHVSSITLLMSDAHSKLFSLHVETEASVLASAREVPDEELVDALEPVLMVPTDSLDDELLNKVIYGMDPEVLSMYLVPQASEEQVVT